MKFFICTVQCWVFSFQLSRVARCPITIHIFSEFWIQYYFILLYFAHQKYKSMGIVNANTFLFICFLHQRCSATVICLRFNENVYPIHNILNTVCCIHDDCTLYTCKLTFNDSSPFLIYIILRFIIQNPCDSINEYMHLHISHSFSISFGFNYSHGCIRHFVYHRVLV